MAIATNGQGHSEHELCLMLSRGSPRKTTRRVE